MYASAAQARRCQRGDIRLVEDQRTGLVHNAAFRPDLMEYDEHYQNEQAVSAQFRAHLDAVARIVERNMGLDGLVEIGCGKGGSLQMWKRYLGPHAQIVGLDIRPACKAFEDDQVAVRIGDRSDEAFLARVLEECGPPQMVLDDGSHVMRHVRASVRRLYPRMDPAGISMVEDMHTAYLPQYGGGLRQEGSVIELCKTLVDEPNADWTQGAPAPTAFTRSTLSMHVYDSIVAFERGRHLGKSAPRIGRAGPPAACPPPLPAARFAHPRATGETRCA